jgi:nucleoside 2-deoxyribosyltransferase
MDCFIIQPFDNGGKFDKRYNECFKPALLEAGLEPYRVDNDLLSEGIYQSIENGIRSAAIIFADISEKNPNVWYEVGFAFALGKPIILVMEVIEGHKIPFDIHDRRIEMYRSESASDFEKLKNSIVERGKALVSKIEKSPELDQKIESIVRIDSSEFEAYELSIIAILGEEVSGDGYAGFHEITSKLSKFGYNKLAASTGIQSLITKNMVHKFYDHDYNGNEFSGLRLTEEGIKWLLRNLSKFTLMDNNAKAKSVLKVDNDSDLPF